MTSRLASLTTILIVAFGGAAIACGSDESARAAGGGGSGGSTTDAGLDGNNSDDAASDAPTDAGRPDTQIETGPCVDVTSLTGSVVDVNDAPLSGMAAIVCITKAGGSALCLAPQETNASGQFSVTMPDGSACVAEVAYQIKDFEDLTKASLYCVVDIATGGDVVSSSPAKIVNAPQCTRDPLGNVTQTHVVTAPDGASMTVIPDKIFLLDFAYEDLRLLAWDSASWGWPCFIDPSNAPDGLVAFAPEIEVKQPGGLKVSFANDKGLAAGTVVDLYALGGAATMTADDKLVREGHWEIIGEAEVTSDGFRIEARDGGGLPFGTWVGWKQK